VCGSAASLFYELSFAGTEVFDIEAIRGRVLGQRHIKPLRLLQVVEDLQLTFREPLQVTAIASVPMLALRWFWSAQLEALNSILQ